MLLQHIEIWGSVALTVTHTHEGNVTTSGMLVTYVDTIGQRQKSSCNVLLGGQIRGKQPHLSFQTSMPVPEPPFPSLVFSQRPSSTCTCMVWNNRSRSWKTLSLGCFPLSQWCSYLYFLASPATFVTEASFRAASNSAVPADFSVPSPPFSPSFQFQSFSRYFP